MYVYGVYKYIYAHTHIYTKYIYTHTYIHKHIYTKYILYTYIFKMWLTSKFVDCAFVNLPTCPYLLVTTKHISGMIFVDTHLWTGAEQWKPLTHPIFLVLPEQCSALLFQLLYCKQGFFCHLFSAIFRKLLFSFWVILLFKITPKCSLLCCLLS